MEQIYDKELKDYIVWNIAFPDPNKAWDMICRLVKTLGPYYQDIKNNSLLYMTLKATINRALIDGRFDSAIVGLPRICDEHKILQENTEAVLNLEKVCVN